MKTRSEDPKFQIGPDSPDTSIPPDTTAAVVKLPWFPQDEVDLSQRQGWRAGDAWTVIDAYSPDKLLELGSQPDINPKLEKPSLGESISTQGGVAYWMQLLVVKKLS